MYTSLRHGYIFDILWLGRRHISPEHPTGARRPTGTSLSQARWVIVRPEANSCTRAGGCCRPRLRRAVQAVTESRVAAPMLPNAPPLHCAGVHRGGGGCTHAADHAFGASYWLSPRAGWRHPPSRLLSDQQHRLGGHGAEGPVADCG